MLPLLCVIDSVIFVCVHLCVSVHRQERELQAVLQSSSVEALRAEVVVLQSERAELEARRRRLDQEMETLNTHTAARTQMDMLRKDKVTPPTPHPLTSDLAFR